MKAYCENQLVIRNLQERVLSFFLRERERMCVSGGAAEGEGKREILSRFHAQQGTHHGARSHPEMTVRS